MPFPGSVVGFAASFGFAFCFCLAFLVLGGLLFLRSWFRCPLFRPVECLRFLGAPSPSFSLRLFSSLGFRVRPFRSLACRCLGACLPFRSSRWFLESSSRVLFRPARVPSRLFSFLPASRAAFSVQLFLSGFSSWAFSPLVPVSVSCVGVSLASLGLGRPRFFGVGSPVGFAFGGRWVFPFLVLSPPGARQAFPFWEGVRRGRVPFRFSFLGRALPA